MEHQSSGLTVQEGGLPALAILDVVLQVQHLRAKNQGDRSESRDTTNKQGKAAARRTNLVSHRRELLLLRLFSLGGHHVAQPLIVLCERARPVSTPQAKAQQRSPRFRASRARVAVRQSMPTAMSTKRDKQRKRTPTATRLCDSDAAAFQSANQAKDTGVKSAPSIKDDQQSRTPTAGLRARQPSAASRILIRVLSNRNARVSGWK